MKTQKLTYFNNKLNFRILFLPLTWIYLIIAYIKKLLTHSYKSKAYVICVGNIMVGGVGKTPLVIKIVEHFLNNGIKVGILSRGYKGKLSSSKPILINTKKHSANDVGDEAFMIASKFNGKVPVCICKNRANSAKVLENQVDVLIMDDGLQNYTLKKDKVILVFDGQEGIGNGFLLPLGRLRESLKSGLKKSDIIIFMRKDNKNLKNKIKKYRKNIFIGKIETKKITNLKNKKIIAFAGIGKPDKFYKSLEKEGAKIIKKFNFPDHYQYTKNDLLNLIKKSNNLPIFTTMKDFVKIPAELKSEFNILDIDINISNQDKFYNLLKNPS